MEQECEIGIGWKIRKDLLSCTKSVVCVYLCSDEETSLHTRAEELQRAREAITLHVYPSSGFALVGLGVFIYRPIIYLSFVAILQDCSGA